MAQGVRTACCAVLCAVPSAYCVLIVGEWKPCASASQKGLNCGSPQHFVDDFIAVGHKQVGLPLHNLRDVGSREQLLQFGHGNWNGVKSFPDQQLWPADPSSMREALLNHCVLLRSWIEGFNSAAA